MTLDSLPGVYESVKIEVEREGSPSPEEVRPGLFTFTRDGRLAVVSASGKSVMAYAGSWRVEDAVLRIAVDSCVHRDMEGKTISRRIVSFDGNILVLEAISADKRERALLTWRKTAAL